jgi:PAS domain S-box-containing protein
MLVSYIASPIVEGGQVAGGVAALHAIIGHKRIEEFHLLHTISVKMYEAEDLTSALEIVLREACEATSWIFGQAWLPCQDGTALECSSAWFSRFQRLEDFHTASRSLTFPPGTALPGLAWSSGQPVWRRDVTLDTTYTRWQTAQELGLKAAMAIPVLAGGTAVAVLEFYVFEPREEDEQLVALVSAVAAQLASIIQHKQAEAALARQAALLDLVHDAILVRDLHNSTILFWYHGAEQMYGWRKEAAVGQVSHALLQTEFPKPLEEVEAELSRIGCWEGELVQRKRDGTRIVLESRWAIQQGEHGEPIAILEVNKDITKRKRAEAERMALLVAEQERSERLRELATLKSDFMAMIAHELNSPLAAIRWSAAMLATGDIDADDQTQVIRAIQTETSLLTSLVADVRTVATMEHDDFVIQSRRVPVSMLLENAAAFVRSLPGAHPFRMVNTTDTTVWADPDRIAQVLRNLLSNAAKYSPDGTPIELRVVLHGGHIRIEVTDYGPGIHPDDMARIFEKFGRGRALFGKKIAGVGLGLYLSRHIVQAHGSELTVHSTLGVGSTFAFELKAAP